MVLVDSSVWIEAARRQGDLETKVALRALLEEYEAAWCSVVKLEVLGGARKQERRAMGTLFGCIPFFECRERDWDRARELAWIMRDAGHTLPWNDVLVAAIAHERALRVYARDAHFETMQALGLVRLYRPGYAGGYAPEEETEG